MPFHFVGGFLCCAEIFSLVWSHMSIFALVVFVWGFKKIITKSYVKNIITYISYKSFMVSGLTYKSLIHFELNFVYDVRQWSSFILYTWLPSLPNTIYSRDCSLPIICSWLLCHKLIAHMCVGLFLDSLFHSIDLCVCFYASNILFYCCSFVIQLTSGNMLSQLFYSFTRLLSQFSILYDSI